jgi:hypothetical protein
MLYEIFCQFEVPKRNWIFSQINDVLKIIKEIKEALRFLGINKTFGAVGCHKSSVQWVFLILYDKTVLVKYS